MIFFSNTAGRETISFASIINTLQNTILYTDSQMFSSFPLTGKNRRNLEHRTLEKMVSNHQFVASACGCLVCLFDVDERRDRHDPSSFEKVQAAGEYEVAMIFIWRVHPVQLLKLFNF